MPEKNSAKDWSNFLSIFVTSSTGDTDAGSGLKERQYLVPAKVDAIVDYETPDERDWSHHC
tara:strand:- start:28028 stop:28210 length:183 start_codon:yes stop_codon:yes gene_type:complete